METSQLLYDALKLKYKSIMAESIATLNVYFTCSVGIGEHPQHLEEMDKLLQNYTDAHDKLNSLNDLYCSKFKKNAQNDPHH